MEKTAATVNLSKGAKANLTKDHALTAFLFGLGWTPKTGANNPGEKFDADAFAICLGADGKIWNGDLDKSLLYFNSNKNNEGAWKDTAHPYPFILDGAIKHSGDNRDGEGDGDDEQITIEHGKLPAEVAEVLLCANIYEAKERKQNFGQIQNAFCRICDPSKTEQGQEIMRIDLSEDASMDTGFVLGKIYRSKTAGEEGHWKFQAIGTPINGDINEICKSYL